MALVIINYKEDRIFLDGFLYWIKNLKYLINCCLFDQPVGEADLSAPEGPG